MILFIVVEYQYGTDLTIFCANLSIFYLFLPFQLQIEMNDQFQ